MGKIRDRIKELMDPAKIITDTVLGVATGAAEIVDRFVQNPQEKQEALLALREFSLKEQEVAMKKDAAIVADRQSAREMYMHDSLLQKVFAIVFLVGYLSISVLMIVLVVKWMGGAASDVPTWAVSLISTVFGAMSAKVNTIIDFLFGGSQGERDTQRIQAGFQEVPNG